MTAEELCALPENNRLDRRLIGGRLVERSCPFQSPAHAKVIANLCGILQNWKRSAARSGWNVYGYRCAFRLVRDPDTLVFFDSSIVRKEVAAATPASVPFVVGPPAGAFEVVDVNDPIDALRELAEVTDLGIPLLWLIDPIEEYVEVHRPGCGSVILDGADDLITGFVGPDLRCPVSELFE
jgi:Uma2 family endonuclease